MIFFAGTIFYTIINAPNVYAGCCVNVAQDQCIELSAGSSSSCNPPNFFYTESCSAIPLQCSPGCCCFENGGLIMLNGTCRAQNGLSFNFQTTNQATCNDICQGASLPRYSISGIVKNNSVPIGGVTVNITNRGISTTSALTGSIGYYIFSNLEAGSLSILAKKDQCSWQGSVELNSDKQLDIELNCCEYSCTYSQCTNGVQTKTCNAINPEFCDIDTYNENVACGYNLCDWECSEWNPPEDQICPSSITHRTRTCTPIIENGCVVGTGPDLTTSCTYATSSCGNGIRESGEMCDYDPLTGLGESNCPSPYNTKDWCNSDCTCKGYTFSECSGESPVFSVGHIPSVLAVDMNWLAPQNCIESIEYYKIFGCDNSSGFCNPTNITSNIQSSDTQLIFTGIPNILTLGYNKEYCFYLETKYDSSIPTSPLVKSETKCITMGDQKCYGEHLEAWCDFDDGLSGIFYCNAENTATLETLCNPGFCTMINGQPQCNDATTCDQCNGLLGLFGYRGFTINTFGSSQQPSRQVLCPGTNVFENRLAYYLDFEEEFAGCYLDYSSTTVDKTYSCDDVTSCYDYKSKSACEYDELAGKDSCGMFTSYENENMCEWEYYSEVFNKGVCRPKIEFVNQDLAVQHCEYCSDEKYNRIYGDCTADTCGLYGACYFNNDNECVDATQIACSGYTNENDCIGESQTIVNTTWAVYPGTSIYFKNGGDNKILSSSNDYFNIKKCYWNGTTCYRNADNFAIGDLGRDCAKQLSSDKKAQCERDNFVPVSSINNNQYYSTMMNLRGQLNVFDNNSIWPLGDNYSSSINTRDTIWVYYCVQHQSAPLCYPNNILKITSPYEEQNFVVNIAGPYHNNDALKLRYFAEDAAKNLEEIKSFNFIIDRLPPEITLKHSTRTYQVGDEWLTDLQVSINLSSEINLPVTCYFNITPTNNENMIGNWEDFIIYDIPSPAYPNNNVIRTVPGGLGTTYAGLLADRYKYYLRCDDNSGNSITQNGTFVIQGDLTINGPSPAGETFTSQDIPEEISINATADGTCKYSMVTASYSDMEHTYQKSIVNNGVELYYKHHDSMNNALGGSGITGGGAGGAAGGSAGVGFESRIYKIYTACNLAINGQNKILNGDSSDLIYFAIDDLSPITRMVYDPDPSTPGGLENFTNNITMDKVRIYLVNDDNTAVLTNINGESMAFGASQTFYCIRDAQGKCDMQEYDLDPLTDEGLLFDYTDPTTPPPYGAYPELCYYSVDAGMNVEQTKCLTLKLRNKDFAAPDITIIPID